MSFGNSLDQIEDLSSVTPGGQEITPIPLLISRLSVQFFTNGGVTPIMFSVLATVSQLMLIRVFQLFASDGPYIVLVVDDEPILGPLLKQPDKHKSTRSDSPL
jgi:hypothetical protein